MGDSMISKTTLEGEMPRKQADRIYAYYFMDMTLEEIAAADGTSVQAIYYSIQEGKKKSNRV